MITGELRGKVGTTPATTMLRINERPTRLGQAAEAPTLTEDEYRAADIEVRKKQAFWNAFAAFGTSTLSILALLGILATYLKTGKLKTPKS